MKTNFGLGLLVLVVGLFTATAAFAQGQVTAADIQRLQDNAFDASSDISRARARDPRLADSLERELADLRDEVIYLKVKLRKESNVSRAEYTDLRDRIDRVRNEARGEPARAAAESRPSAAPLPPPPPAPVATPASPTEIPVGTE